MSRQFSTLAEELGIERDKNLIFALEYLSERDSLPSEHSAGRLRTGNVLLLAKAILGSWELQQAIQDALNDGEGYPYVPDTVIEDVVRFLRHKRFRTLDSLNDELQVVTDLAYAAGLAREVELLTEAQGVHPSPSVTAPLATR